MLITAYVIAARWALIDCVDHSALPRALVVVEGTRKGRKNDDGAGGAASAGGEIEFCDPGKFRFCSYCCFRQHLSCIFCFPDMLSFASLFSILEKVCR